MASRRKRPARPAPSDPDLEVPGVEIGRDFRGQAYTLPDGWRRLDPQLVACLREAQELAQGIAQLTAQLDAVAVEARLAGASWGHIGVATMRTPEGARRRWADVVDELGAAPLGRD